MPKKLKLDSLDVYSADTERVANSIKRVIRFSDNEKKLFGCFDWYRNQALAKDKALWDRSCNHFINREMGRMHISQDFADKVRANLNNDVEIFQRQQVGVGEGNGVNPVETTDTSAPVEDFVGTRKEALLVDEHIVYADMVRLGHEEAVFLGHILDILWKHQDKDREVINDDTGNKHLSKLDQRDRSLDFARYMDSRAKWFKFEECQAVLKANIESSSGKQRRNAKKRMKKKQKGEDAGKVDASEACE